MADNKGAVIFLAIIAVGALGLSGYMFTMDLIRGNEVVDDGNLRLVALWDHLGKNLTSNPTYSTDSNFLVEFKNQMVLDTNYVNVINNTRLMFPKAGLYKIDLTLLTSSLSETDVTIWIILYANNTQIGYYDRYETANPIVSSFHYTSGSVYINSTGDDTYYEINAHCNSPTENFGISTSAAFNQLAIEYVLD